jgi:hypothetical protein
VEARHAVEDSENVNFMRAGMKRTKLVFGWMEEGFEIPKRPLLLINKNGNTSKVKGEIDG